MAVFTRSIVLFCAFSLSCLAARVAADNVIDPSWLKPGALDRWNQRQRKQAGESCEAQEQPATECICPPPLESSQAKANNDITEEQKLSPVFYRKLVTTLFQRDVLQLEPTGAFYDSVVTLKVTTKQLDKVLNVASSIREIDATLSEILEQSNNIRRKYVLQENRCERLYNFLLEVAESRILHNILPILLMLSGCFVIRIVSKYTRMHPFLVFLLLIFSTTVFSKWKECNRELAKKSLQNSFDESNPICDPMQVLMDTTVSMQASYFNALFKHFMNAFTEHTHKRGIFEKVLIGLLLLGFAYVLLTTLLQVGIASGFRLFGDIAISAMHSPARAALENDGAAAAVLQPLPAVNLNIHIRDSAVGGNAQVGLMQLESQRIEIVPDEREAIGDYEKILPVIKDKVEEIEKSDEHPKEDDSTPESFAEEKKQT